MIETRNLGSENSIFNQYISELRNVDVQHDRMRFRRNLERIGEIFAYEISKTFSYRPVEITTPLGTKTMQLMAEQPILATILRAGLPLHRGFLNIFDNADNAFISAFRDHHADGTFDIKLGYMASPALTGRTLIIADPMLATGQSMVSTYNEILEMGAPKCVHIACAIASTQGVRHLQDHLKADNCTLWLGAIDDELNDKSYIVPGLGDAGDLAFGEKDANGGQTASPQSVPHSFILH